MKSAVLPSFWEEYSKLDKEIKNQAKKAYQLWRKNPFHPSLHFKCVHQKENVWSLRVSRGYRALCLFEGDTVTWFWVGNHGAYEKLIRKKM